MQKLMFIRHTGTKHSYLFIFFCLPCMSSDSIGSLVVLHLQRSGVPGHSLFHPEEEIHPGQLPPRLPSLHHVHPLVDRHQMGPWRPMWVKGLFIMTECAVRRLASSWQSAGSYLHSFWKYPYQSWFCFPCSVLWGNHQLLHPCAHVRLLWPGRLRTSDAEVPLVEEIPHHYSNGWLFFCISWGSFRKETGGYLQICFCL